MDHMTVRGRGQGRGQAAAVAGALGLALAIALPGLGAATLPTGAATYSHYTRIAVPRAHVAAPRLLQHVIQHGDASGGRAPVRGSSPPGPNITMSAQAGYGFAGGYNYRLNGPSVARQGAVWVPIHIILRNDGPDLTGRLVIADTPQGGNNGPSVSYRTDLTLDVTLPGGSRKAFTMYVRAADLGSQLNVDLLDANGHGVTSTTLNTVSQQNAQQSSNLSVGVLSDDTAALRAALRSLKFGDTGLSVAQFDDTAPLDTLPAALDNVDLIVLDNYASEALGAARVAALHSWVQGGGTLLVVGGSQARKTMGRLSPDLLAATLTGTAVENGLPELAAIAGSGADARGSTLVSVATPRPGATVLVAHQGVPLVVDAPLGRGHLMYSAVEPTLAPVSAWSSGQQSQFWERVLAPGLVGPRDALIEDGAPPPPNASNNNNSSPGSLTSDLSTPPGQSLPALQIYVFLIVLYVLVLGPGNYIILRWRRRLEWSWVTVPLAAVIFGLISFGLAYARNGGDVVANVDTVVFLNGPDATKTVDSYLGVSSPFQGDYDLTIPGAGQALAWGLGGDNGPSGGSGGNPLGMSVDEGPRFAARLLGMGTWTERNVAIEQQLTLPGTVTGQLLLRGGSVSGQLTNTTSLTLHDVVVVGNGGTSAVIPRINPGGTVRVRSFALSGNGTVSGSNGSYGSSTPGPLLNNLYAASVPGGAGGTGLLAAPAPAVASPATLASSDRYGKILGAVFPTGFVATPSAPLALIGWSTDGVGGFAVNGSAPRRTNLDLVVAPLGLSIAPGAYTLQPGDIPVGSLTTSTGLGNNAASGLNLSSSDHLDVQFIMPHAAAGRRLTVETLTVQTYLNFSNGSASLGADSFKLWNWRRGRWEGIDLSSGPRTIGPGQGQDHRDPTAYVSPEGRVLLHLDPPGQTSIGNVDQSLLIGVTGKAL